MCPSVQRVHSTGVCRLHKTHASASVSAVSVGRDVSETLHQVNSKDPSGPNESAPPITPALTALITALMTAGQINKAYCK